MKSEVDKNICVGCGFCCDGTLFQHGKLSAQELADFRETKLNVDESANGARFRQPCIFFTGRCCSIYDRRFAVCRSFRCKLLRRLEAGEIGFEEADKAIEQAKRLLAEVIARDPAARRSADRQELRLQLTEELSESSGETRRQIARRLLNIVALDAFLDGKFRIGKMEESVPTA